MPRDTFHVLYRKTTSWVTNVTLAHAIFLVHRSEGSNNRELPLFISQELQQQNFGASVITNIVKSECVLVPLR